MDGSTAGNTSSLDLTSILGLLGGTGSGTSLDLSSILGLLGGTTGTSISVDGSTASAASDTTVNVGGSTSVDLASILEQLGGNTGTVSVEGGTAGVSLDLSSILALLGDSGTSLNVNGDKLNISFSLSSILELLRNMGTSVSVETKTFAVKVMPVETASSETAAGVLRGASVPQTASVLSWDDDESVASEGYWVEIARGSEFDGAIRMFTAGTAFDVDGSAGVFSCRATLKDGTFTEDAVEWTAETSAPRQIVSNGNGRADIFFASPAEGDVWTAGYYAGNAITGDLADVVGKNRIRDTFSGSASDANILYLTDDANGDALFMDDIYSEFGSAARLDLIREIRSGAGGDVIDMTSDRYTAELAGMTVRGGSGDDVLWGAAGGNLLFGDEGDDSIVGGSGDDVIAGGSGNDVLNGGGGSDLFAFGENWGDDVVSQFGDGSVTLWFLEDESKISISARNGSIVFRNEAGTSSVTLAASALANLTVLHGDDGSARFAELSAAGAFLGSTAESVFETQSARTQGILASL